MSEIAKLIVEQNLRIEARKKEFSDATLAFACLFEDGKNVDAKLKKDSLLNLHQKAKVYFCCVESSIVEGCVAGAFEHPTWLQDTAGSAEKVLSGIPNLFAHLRKHRSKLGFVPGTFEPSGNIFQNMQGILALARPEKAKELKQQFIEAKLPHDCFDKPLKPKPMKPEKNNPWTSGSFYLFAYAIILIGLIALIKYVPLWAVPPALIALILLLIVIGALQLKNDSRLKDKSFVELMTLVMRRLFLLKQSPNDKSS